MKDVTCRSDVKSITNEKAKLITNNVEIIASSRYCSNDFNVRAEAFKEYGYHTLCFRKIKRFVEAGQGEDLATRVALKRKYFFADMAKRIVTDNEEVIYFNDLYFII